MFLQRVVEIAAVASALHHTPLHYSNLPSFSLSFIDLADNPSCVCSPSLHLLLCFSRLSYLFYAFLRNVFFQVLFSSACCSEPFISILSLSVPTYFFFTICLSLFFAIHLFNHSLPIFIFLSRSMFHSPAPIFLNLLYL